jgi:hypothetical protein
VLLEFIVLRHQLAGANTRRSQRRIRQREGHQAFLASHDFKLALTRVIEPARGPGAELATLEDAARFVCLMQPWRQARLHLDFAAELLLKAGDEGRRRTWKRQRRKWSARCGLSGGRDASRRRHHPPRHCWQARRDQHRMRQARPQGSGGSNPALSVPSRSSAQIEIQKPLYPGGRCYFPDYLLLEVEPVTSGGGGIMFHVSARYFQFAPSSTMTLR